MQDVLKNKIKIDGDIAILQNYQNTDNIEDFFTYCFEQGVDKYLISDSFGSKYIYLENGTLKNVPEDNYDLISNHIKAQPEELPILSVDPNIEEYTEEETVAKTYTEEEYETLKSEKEELAKQLDEKEKYISRYSVAIEFFEKIRDIVKKEFEESIKEMEAKVQIANDEKDKAIEKLENFKTKMSALLD